MDLIIAAFPSSLSCRTKCGKTNRCWLFQECSTSNDFTHAVTELSSYFKIWKITRECGFVSKTNQMLGLFYLNLKLQCIYVCCTHTAMFVEIAVKLSLSTSSSLDSHLLWRAGFGPLSAAFSEWSHPCPRLSHYLKRPFQETVFSFSLNICSFLHLGCVFLLMTPWSIREIKARILGFFSTCHP